MSWSGSRTALARACFHAEEANSALAVMIVKLHQPPVAAEKENA